VYPRRSYAYKLRTRFNPIARMKGPKGHARPGRKSSRRSVSFTTVHKNLRRVTWIVRLWRWALPAGVPWREMGVPVPGLPASKLETSRRWWRALRRAGPGLQAAGLFARGARRNTSGFLEGGDLPCTRCFTFIEPTSTIHREKVIARPIGPRLGCLPGGRISTETPQPGTS